MIGQAERLSWNLRFMCFRKLFNESMLPETIVLLSRSLPCIHVLPGQDQYLYVRELSVGGIEGTTWE